jgi:hypothetical protein
MKPREKYGNIVAETMFIIKGWENQLNITGNNVF